MRRFSRTVPLLALLMLVASLAGAAQTDVAMTEEATEDGVSMRLLLFINEVGLDQEQMETVAGLFRAVLDGREQLTAALEATMEAFEDEMLAFTGTSDELAAIVEAYRTETAGMTEAYEASIDEMIETLGDTLTYAQGQVFFSALPELAPEGFFTTNRDEGGAMDMRTRMMQILQSRRPGMDRMRSRLTLGLLEQITEILELKLAAIS